MERLRQVPTFRSGQSVNIANGNDYPIETLEECRNATLHEAQEPRVSPRQRVHTTQLSAVLDSIRGSVLTANESRPQTAESSSSAPQPVTLPPLQSSSTSIAEDEVSKAKRAAHDAADDERHLRHCDRLLLAPLFVIALLHGFDKNVSHAKTMKMDISLGISSTQWSILLIACYLGFIIGTVVVVIYVRAQGKRLLAILTTLTIMMGTVTSLIASSSQFNYAWLWITAIRFLQGLFEAGFNAMMATYLLQFYTAAQLAPRMLLFFLAPAGASGLGALYAYAMIHIRGAMIDNWQAFYLGEGLLTVFCGIAAWFWLPSDWANASWHRALADAQEESKELDAELGLESPLQRTTTLQFIDEGFDLRQLKCLIRSVPGRSWMLADISLGLTTALILLYLPQFIEKLGFSSPHANLMTVFPYIGALAVLLVSLKLAPGTDQARAWLLMCIFALQAVGFLIYYIVMLQLGRQTATASVTSPNLERTSSASDKDLSTGFKVLGYLSLFLAASGVGTSNVLAAKLYGLRIDDHALRLVVNTVGVALINVAGGIASWAPSTGKQEAFGLAFAAFGFLVTSWSLADDYFIQRKNRNANDEKDGRN
ncbi:major facilitator superfamily domain-containing protein [Protomyces lactucae-debilis]|uniref:Major facilitator superfamily domain-containing protein n=1 Tax=Protomyces lactucae-debilis TaxID=2754530 RepID=A0A1Y2F7Y6_PROLT|nr:major facilitator superfamily domain-containing protein [Protomyces lactucae-debilis]ORY79973.1 major facilitator superfamily domain-containing protein [Protomyces lactucae-debilis]